MLPFVSHNYDFTFFLRKNLFLAYRSFTLEKYKNKVCHNNAKTTFITMKIHLLYFNKVENNKCSIFFAV